MQQIAAASQASPLLHGHVSRLLLHPPLIRVRRESCQVHPASLQVDEDGWDAKEGKVERNRQGGVAVYLYWGGLQPVPIAKPDGQNVTRGFDKPARSIEKPKPLPYHSAKTQN